MSFYVGQKVVCVDDDFVKGNYGIPMPPNVPVKGTVYTIREFSTRREGELFVRLSEVVNEKYPLAGFEPAFNTSRFRPIVKSKSSISFTEGAPLDSEQWDGRKGKVRA